MWGQKEYSNLWRWNRLFSVRWLLISLLVLFESWGLYHKQIRYKEDPLLIWFQRNMTNQRMATGSPTRMEDWTMLWREMMITGHCLSEGLKLQNDPKWFYWNHHESRIKRTTMWNIDGAFAGTVWVVRKKEVRWVSCEFWGFQSLIVTLLALHIPLYPLTWIPIVIILGILSSKTTLFFFEFQSIEFQESYIGSASDCRKNLENPPAADVSPAVPTSILWPGVELFASVEGGFPSHHHSWWFLDVKKEGTIQENTIVARKERW